MAQVVRARVDGQMFILDPKQDVEELERQIIQAVQQGAGFVRFDTLGRSAMRVLITPTIGVRFEILERSEEQLNEWAENPPSIEPGDAIFDELMY